MRIKFGKELLSVGTLIATLLVSTSGVFANELISPSYIFEESTLGAGGQIESASTSFRSANSAGDLGVGESSSGNFQMQAGSQTTRDPTLSFAIDSTSTNFGNFSATASSTGTAQFSVINYTAYGYAVLISGPPPTNGASSITSMSVTGTSLAGSSQFGINLVANTSPSAIGANPLNDASTQYGTQFGFGQVSSNYATTNQYRYVSGETIAQAPRSSGKTTYTMSYLVNVSVLTSGGRYTSNQTLIVVGTY